MHKSLVKRFLVVFLTALVMMVPVCFLSACGILGGSNEQQSEPQDTETPASFAFAIRPNDEKYKIISNDSSDGYEISISDGCILSESDIKLRVIVKGKPVPASNYKISFVKSGGKVSQINISYNNEVQSISVLTEQLIDFGSVLENLKFSYEEIASGKSKYIDVIDKIDAAMRKANFESTLSELKAQGIVDFKTATQTKTDPYAFADFTRSNMAGITTSSGTMDYHFYLHAQSGYVFEDEDGERTDTLMVNWQILPIEINLPTRVIADLVFDPTKAQTPTLVFAGDNEKINSMIEVDPEFMAGSYTSVSYRLKKDYEYGYVLLDQFKKPVFNVNIMRNWEIKPLKIKAPYLDKTEFDFDGTEKCPNLILPENYEYLFDTESIQYSDNTEVGTGTVSFELVENYDFGVTGYNIYSNLSRNELCSCFTYGEGNIAPQGTLEFTIIQQS